MNCKTFNISKTCAETHISLIFNSLEDVSVKFSEAAKALADDGAKVLTVELFAPAGYAAAAENFKVSMSAENAPTMHVLPLDEVSAPMLAGAHIIALKGAEIKFTQSATGSKAAVYSTEDAQFCRIMGVSVPDSGGDADKYTVQTLAELEATLQTCGFEFSDIVRTWFFNRDILDWYAGFNSGRTSFFKEHNVFCGLLPASTGIGAPNPFSTRIQSGVLAVKGAAKKGYVYEIPSPLQGGAPEYGSSFSRAVEMNYDTYKRVIISGTASIDPLGNTLYYGEIDAQVELTMQVIEGILVSRGLSFDDVHRAVVYCMNPKFYESFVRWSERNGKIPHVPAYNTVCRSDLMFEVELDASGA